MEQVVKKQRKRKREEKKTELENLKPKKLNENGKLEETSEIDLQISYHYDDSDNNSSNQFTVNCHVLVKYEGKN